MLHGSRRLDGRARCVRTSAGGRSGDYLALELAGGGACGLAPTCAEICSGTFRPMRSRAATWRARRTFALVAGRRVDPIELARAVLERAVAKVSATCASSSTTTISMPRRSSSRGRRRQAALVPFAAEKLGFPFRIARDAEVISPLGVALALVRDVVERTIVDPQPDDVVRVRREAIERVVAAGAAPEFVEATVEIDARRNLVRAIASGATAAAGDAHRRPAAAVEARRAAAARALQVVSGALELAAAGDAFETYARGAADVRRVRRRPGRRGALAGAPCRPARDDGGSRGGVARERVDEATAFGDVGRALPEIALAYRARVADLGTLAEPQQVLALAAEELRGLAGDELVVILAARRDA